MYGHRDVLQEVQKIGGKQFAVVYFNADAGLPSVPDTTWLQQLHAGLPPAHKQQLQVSSGADAWFMLQLRLLCASLKVCSAAEWLRLYQLQTATPAADASA